MTDDYDQNDEGFKDGNYTTAEADNTGVGEAIEDYGDEDDMVKEGAMTDESCVDEEERDSNKSDFREDFSSASSNSSSEDDQVLKKRLKRNK